MNAPPPGRKKACHSEAGGRRIFFEGRRAIWESSFASLRMTGVLFLGEAPVLTRSGQDPAIRGIRAFCILPAEGGLDRPADRRRGEKSLSF